MERFETAAGCSPLADKIKVAGLEVSYWPPRDPSQRFYWLNLHFVSTHIAEGGPPRIWSKMGFFLQQKFHRWGKNGFLFLEETRMKGLLKPDIISGLTWKKINCTESRATHPQSMYRGQKPWQLHKCSINFNPCSSLFNSFGKN